MIHVWLIIVMGSGDFGGSVGPLPYDMTECSTRAERMQKQADAKPKIAQGMKFQCVGSEKRPGGEIPK